MSYLRILCLPSRLSSVREMHSGVRSDQPGCTPHGHPVVIRLYSQIPPGLGAIHLQAWVRFTGWRHSHLAAWGTCRSRTSFLVKYLPLVLGIWRTTMTSSPATSTGIRRCCWFFRKLGSWSWSIKSMPSPWLFFGGTELDGCWACCCGVWGSASARCLAWSPPVRRLGKMECNLLSSARSSFVSVTSFSLGRRSQDWAISSTAMRASPKMSSRKKPERSQRGPTLLRLWPRLPSGRNILTSVPISSHQDSLPSSQDG